MESNFQFECNIRSSYTDEAKKELEKMLRDLEVFTDQEIMMMALSSIMDQSTRSTFPLTLKEEAVRLTMNRRLYHTWIASL